ncbi:hypothetical protein OROGR_016536 [Orobanche gracilis]
MGTNSGSTVIDPSVSSAILDDFSMLSNVDFLNPSDYLVGGLCSTQDVQSQVTTASLADSPNFFFDNPVGASSSNVDLDDSNFLHQGSFQQVTPRFRTYTKYSFKRQDLLGDRLTSQVLRITMNCVLKLNACLVWRGWSGNTGYGWKLVYVDFENDVLLVGDDPWSGICGLCKMHQNSIPSEVKQMGEEGMQLLNSAAIQGVDAS